MSIFHLSSNRGAFLFLFTNISDFINLVYLNVMKYIVQWKAKNIQVTELQKCLVLCEISSTHLACCAFIWSFPLMFLDFNFWFIFSRKGYVWNTCEGGMLLVVCWLDFALSDDDPRNTWFRVIELEQKVTLFLGIS